MTVINTLKQSVVMLGKDNLLQTLPLGGQLEPDTNEEKELDLLLFCFNQVLQTIASDYLPILKEKQILAQHGSVALTDIDTQLIEIKKVELDGVSIGFKVVGNVLKTAKGNLLVTYAVSPNQCHFNDSMEDFDLRISERTIALGVATEHSFITGEYTQAAVWENRFKAALESACRKKSDILIPPRRWL